MTLFSLILVTNLLSAYCDLWGNSLGTITEFNQDLKEYGVDVSYPIHHYLNPKTMQGKRYNKMMDG